MRDKSSKITHYGKEDATNHGLHLSRVCIHSPCRLPGFNVTPHHWYHVPLIVHEATVEVWAVVWVSALDMSAASRERIFQEMEHGEEFPGRPCKLVRMKPNT